MILLHECTLSDFIQKIHVNISPRNGYSGGDFWMCAQDLSFTVDEDSDCFWVFTQSNHLALEHLEYLYFLTKLWL